MSAESVLPGDPVVFDRDFAQDPHVRFALMREEAPVRPVVADRGLRGWVITRYDDARAALSDPRVGKDVAQLREIVREQYAANADDRAFDQSLTFHMLNADPPDHTRLRKLVVKAFTPGRVEALAPRVEEITGRLLDEMSGQHEVDLLDAFAFPLPITVISELLGVDESRRDEFREWSITMVNSSDETAVQEAAERTSAYLAELVARKRAEPADDLLSALVHASEDEDRLDARELSAMAFLLLVAGHETTVNLISNTVRALLDDPAQLERLHADPALVPAAIEEGLRFDGPIVNATLRYTTEPVRFGDVEVPARSVLWVSLTSANRDAAKFPEPDRFDITRDPGGHVAFGHGIHFCLGAALARMEGRIALRELLARFPNLRAAQPLDELTWRPSTLIRGLERFPVLLD